MKMIYTKAELKALSTEELEAIMYFGTSEGQTSFSVIKHISNEEVTTIYDNTVSGSPEELQSIRNKKMRYDLLIASVQGSTEDAKSRKEFREEINTVVQAQVTKLEESYDNSKGSLDTMMADMTYKLSSTLRAVNNMFDDMKTTHNRTLTQFDTFNSETYDIKMKKIDKILNSFDKLLD